MTLSNSSALVSLWLIIPDAALGLTFFITYAAIILLKSVKSLGSLSSLSNIPFGISGKTYFLRAFVTCVLVALNITPSGPASAWSFLASSWNTGGSVLEGPACFLPVLSGFSWTPVSTSKYGLGWLPISASRLVVLIPMTSDNLAPNIPANTVALTLSLGIFEMPFAIACIISALTSVAFLPNFFAPFSPVLGKSSSKTFFMPVFMALDPLIPPSYTSSKETCFKLDFNSVDIPIDCAAVPFFFVPNFSCILSAKSFVSGLSKNKGATLNPWEYIFAM